MNQISKQMLRGLFASKLALTVIAAGTLVFQSNAVHAQVPQKFNYQGIARDAKGNPLANKQLGIKISVLPTQDAVQSEYEETQLVTTNEFGLYTLQIGNGTAIHGSMKTVKWETGNKYISVDIDPNGGTNYVNVGTSQLLSVPYAIYSDMAGTAGNAASTTRATNNYIEKTNGAGVANSTSLLYDNGTSIGLGTTTPTARFQISQNAAAVQEHLRMQNLSATGAGRFTLYNDGASSYATFTKYGTAYAGNYGGSSLYPNANLLAFGNNGLAAGDGLGRFLITNGGSIGMSLFKSGVSKLKFHADFATENVGIGGNSAPIARIHANNTDGTTMDIRLTNNTTGHTAADGLEVKNVGTLATVMNKENDALVFGTSNTEKMRITSDGILLLGSSSPLFNSWYRANFYQPTAGEGSAIYLQTADAGNSTVDGAQISLETGPAPELGILNREAGGISFKMNSGTKVKILNNGNVGIGTLTPSATLEVNGSLKFTNGTEGSGKVLTSDPAGGAYWATPTITSSVGNNNYVPKFATSGSSLVNSLIRDDDTSVSIGDVPPVSLNQLYVFRQQLTAKGDGQSTLLGYRTRDNQNDGFDYSRSGFNAGNAGFNFWGDLYSFGVAGHSYNDYSRTGGVLGADVNGAYWGSLGYRSSGLLNYGVYGSSAYVSGGGFLPSNEVAGIGGGFFGSMIGSVSKGKVIGQMNSGELLASYNLGDEYTTGRQIELVNNGTERVPAYSVTSTELTIYKKGKITLQNGIAYVAFDNNYTSLLADVPVVTVTAMGACNGLYIEQIDRKGFTVRELNNGTSNVSVSWISVADRIDQSTAQEVPSEMLQTSFDESLQLSLHDDSNKEQSGQGMWWDGQSKKIRFGQVPASTSPAPKQEQ